MTHKLAKFVLFSACATVVSMFPLAAAPCATGTLTSYIALGSTGCTIGGDTFFNFQLIDNSSGGAPVVPASAITVEGYGPAGTSGASGVAPFLPADIGVDFDAAWSAAAGQSQDDNISFDVSVGNGAASITDAGITQDSAVFGNGSVSVAEKGCSGIVFPCSQQWGVSTNDASFIADTIFSATGTLSVEKDIEVIGGTSGGGSTLSNVADVFSAVPEPRAVSLLLGLGLLAGFALRKKLQGERA